MSAAVRSYVGLFHEDGDLPRIDRIEIPLIQRDFAQGRRQPGVDVIRRDFLDVLVTAVTEGDPVGLDFVYGDLKAGTFRPLDGQQRLTTLFLLHWLIAARLGQLDPTAPWTRFRYATRPSAELFCERIVTNGPPIDVASPAEWIRDQSWFLYTWHNDPTIEAMLVMLDDLDSRLREASLEAAWQRLTSHDQPIITFHVLVVDEIGAGDELYIKMNSRGKPLTPFENFKARFEKALEGSPRAQEFAHKIDGDWSELFWHYRGDDDIVDDEIMRYFSFVTEVVEWRDGRLEAGELDERAERAFGTSTSSATANLDFLFAAFDAWKDVDIRQVFDELLCLPGQAADAQTPFFGVGLDIDHFAACCNTYTLAPVRQRPFGWAETLTLYAVLLHRMGRTIDFPRRLRVLRNLLEGSSNELRLENMPALTAAVTKLVESDSLAAALASMTAFNEAQLDDERQKVSFVERHPTLQETVFALEDLPVLRGSLVAFDLEAERFAQRAAAFKSVMSDPSLWPELTGALLAVGDYSRHPNARSFRFGSSSDERWWRELLTGAKRGSMTRTGEPLATLLDRLTEDQPVSERLESIRAEWLATQVVYDWRYYLVKYPAMRQGRSGIYFTEGGRMGFSLCMLDKKWMNSYYRDPYLSAVHERAGEPDAVQTLWFTGYETDPRWLVLRASGAQLRCVPVGFQLKAPSEQEHVQTFLEVCTAFDVEDSVLRIEQTSLDEEQFDLEDRIERGAALLTALVEAGL